MINSKNFLDEAERILQAASKKGIVLRLIGALGILKHLKRNVSLFGSLGRELSDIDFVSYSKFETEIQKLLSYLGYEMQGSIGFTASIARRGIFFHKVNGRVVDIFYDKLIMNHTVDLSKRLEVDYPTIPLAELFLSKMQIVEINYKDLTDTSILLLEHEIGEKDDETINIKVVTEALSKDWGFYFTVTTNLQKLKKFVPSFETFNENQKAEILNKADTLLKFIEDEPKSLKWKMRSKIGPKIPWYSPVERRM